MLPPTLVLPVKVAFVSVIGQRLDGTSGSREGMFPGLYSEICGRGDRLGCILNLGHSFDAIEAYL